jgi:RHS repeat-associated protein
LTSANKKQKATIENGQAYLSDGIALVNQGQENYSNESHLTGGLPLVSKTVVEQDNEIINHKSKIMNDFDYLGTSLWSEEQNLMKESGNTLTSYRESSTTGGVSLSTPVTSSEPLAQSPLPCADREARFKGKPYDTDLGSYVFPFRNYRPELARWTSADPAVFPGGPKVHFYAPVATNEVDITGLMAPKPDVKPGNPDFSSATFVSGPKLIGYVFFTTRKSYRRQFFLLSRMNHHGKRKLA